MGAVRRWLYLTGWTRGRKDYYQPVCVAEIQSGLSLQAGDGGADALEGVEAVVEVMAPDRARVSIAGETAECFLRGGQWWMPGGICSPSGNL